MTTTLNIEPWHAAMARYERLLQIDRTMLKASQSDLGEEWEQVHDQTSDAFGLLIDTRARSLAKAVAKLRVIIRHAHLEGPSDDIDDTEVRAEALADPMRDGAWPLLRVLEDLEALLPPAGVDGSEELRHLAGRLEGWEQAERDALDAADTADVTGASDQIPMLHLAGLDNLLETVAVRAAAIRARTTADVMHKGRIMQVLARRSRWCDSELELWEQELIASLADDAAVQGAN